MKIPRKVDMINDCIRPWSSIRVSKSLTILRSKKVMGKLMVLRRKSLTIPMLIRSDTYSIRRLWIKSDAIELNAKIIPAISMVFTNAEIYNGLGYERGKYPDQYPCNHTYYNLS